MHEAKKKEKKIDRVLVSFHQKLSARHPRMHLTQVVTLDSGPGLALIWQRFGWFCFQTSMVGWWDSRLLNGAHNHQAFHLRSLGWNKMHPLGNYPTEGGRRERTTRLRHPHLRGTLPTKKLSSSTTLHAEYITSAQLAFIQSDLDNWLGMHSNKFIVLPGNSTQDFTASSALLWLTLETYKQNTIKNT